MVSMCKPKNRSRAGRAWRAAGALLAAFLLQTGYGQMFTLSGTVFDNSDGTTLPGAEVLLVNMVDTTQRRSTVTDLDGQFAFPSVEKGKYELKASFVGFHQLVLPLNVEDGKSPVSLRLKSSTTELQAVEMVAVQRRADQEGDTTIFNAGAYKVNPDATAEDLVTKMPGITSSNGTIMAQGEKVTKVLLDGEEYFGGDAATVLKNLPAEVISKVQVFDKLSDQSQFTGFDDGNTDKTLNIITKEGMNRGVFGTATAGYGTDDRYAGSLSLNWFKDKQRVSLLAQANNINRQNFSSEDLTGLSSGNFTSGTQPGIINTNAIGLNYSNTIGKTKLTGSYFLNNQHGVNSSISERTTFLGDTSLQVANNTSDRISDNASHRLNFRFQTEFNKANSLIITPRLTIQNSSSSQLRTSEVLNGEGALLSGSNNDNRNGRNGLSFSNSLLFRRRFALKGRTFSANLTTSLSGRDGSGSLLARNRFSDDPGSENLVDQRNNIDNFTQNHGLQLRYTEPMGEKGQLQVALSPSVRLSDSEKLTYDSNPDAGTEALDARLSNKALNTVQSMRGGLSYRFKGEGYMFNFGLDGQTSSMHSEQTYPSRFSVDRSYANLLPNAMLSRNWGKLTRLRLMYRTNVSTPSINQLQTVVDNNDPLHLATGNLELDQSYSHAFTLRFNTMNSAKTRPFFALLSVQSQQGRISNVAYAVRQDSTLADGTVLPAGGQLILPMNLDGYLSARAMANYGLAVTTLSSNLNLNAGANAERLPGAVNGNRSFTWNTNWNFGAALTSNISKSVDFNIGYTANFNTARSDLRSNSANAYYQGQLAGMLTLNGLKGWVLENQVNYQHYNGLGAAYDKDALVWNASLGHKFLKNDALELRISAYDILGRNVSVTRDVADTYIANTATNMLQRYFMLSLRYNIRYFKGASAAEMPAVPQEDWQERRAPRRE